MVQVKFSIDEQQAAFLNDYKAYGFKDKSALVRQAIVQFRKQLEMESLRESAELYAELYDEDEGMRDLAETALEGWPQ